MTAIHPRLVVLLADDDENDVLFIGRALERLGVLDRLLTVADGEEVITYFRGLDAYSDRQKYPIPDLLILDHRMPKVSGLDVLFWVRTQKLFERLPILVFTTGLPADQLRILQTLRAVFCAKTGSFPDLLQVMSEAIQTVLPPARNGERRHAQLGGSPSRQVNAGSVR
jgi:CheY-like chemotaxis protein